MSWFVLPPLRRARLPDARLRPRRLARRRSQDPAVVGEAGGVLRHVVHERVAGERAVLRAGQEGWFAKPSPRKRNWGSIDCWDFSRGRTNGCLRTRRRHHRSLAE
jgi:hypothetical protein